MVDWKSPGSLRAQGVAGHKLDLILFGIYLWECCSFLWYDLEVISGRRPFKWPALAYWVTKYSTLGFAISVNITWFQVITKPVNCQALGDFIDLTARIGMAGASGLLTLRTVALWQRSSRVVIPLAILYLGMWGLYLHNVFIVKESWNSSTGTCQIFTVTWPWLKMQFIYTMVYDFLVLALALVALVRHPGRTNLWKMLFVDGISYFMVAFGSYLACTILAYLGISVSLSFMFSDTATILATIAACRSYVRIGTYCTPSSLQTPPPTNSAAVFRNSSITTRDIPVNGLLSTSMDYGRDAIRVQMDIVTSVDSESTSKGPGLTKNPPMQRSDSSDLEAQYEKGRLPSP